MTLMLLVVAWLITYLVHSTILLGGAWALLAVRLVRSHAARDVLWKVALVGGIVTATAQMALALRPAAGQVSLSPVVESADVEARVMVDVPPAAPVAPAGEATPVSADFAAPAPMSALLLARPIGRFHAGWPGMVLNLWLLGALAFGGALVFARGSLRRRLARRRDLSAGPAAELLARLLAETGTRGAVRLTVSDAITSPISLSRREICLPERALSRFSRDELRAVLAHELGHVVRRDPPWQLASAVIGAVLFLQPLNRLARRRLQETAEYLCDDWAAARTGGGLVLARCLAEVATWMSPASAEQLEVVPAMASRPSQLVARVQRLLDGGAVCAARGSRAAVAVLGVAALGLVAITAPGVAAVDLDPGAVMLDEPFEPADTDEWKAIAASDAAGGDGWLRIRDDGRQLVLNPAYTARMTGQGRLGFRRWGRVLRVADGYQVTVNGEAVTAETDVCTDQTVRIVAPDGRVAWVLQPVRLTRNERVLVADPDDPELRELVALSRSLRSLSRTASRSSRGGGRRADIEAELKLDAAIDTLVRAWARDPDAVRLAAARIALSFEHELGPQFESLGVALGRELAPELERVTDRIGRDLVPEFARLGAELGRSLAAAFVESDSAAGPRAGSGDYRDKGKRIR